ncbi:hypothetical protein TNIN_294641 [Trichonephila inaurata madagascariensis]|uniref:Uncharacterized protein n=1 Tax=Trichonephila inaurata madagascariensis TaxID=2747483 RepID=A0A8X6IF76_9ARAC|nr:hypothetical protein TNIN_294641 [Trichonephila inaurata madagascariensis]
MMRAVWIGTGGGGSQNHSPLVVAFFVRLGIRSKRAGRESQFHRVRDPVLGVRRFFSFSLQIIWSLRVYIFIEVSSSHGVGAVPFDAVDKEDSGEMPISICCPWAISES